MVVQVLLTFSSDAKDLCCPTLKLLDATYFSVKVVLTQLKKGAFFGELAVMFVTLALLGGWVVAGSPMSEKTHDPSCFFLR